MASKNCDKNVRLIEKFSLLEKTLYRTGFYGFIIIGAYGIYLQNIVWGIIYTAFVISGLRFGLLYFACSHCPYPYKYSDCLFAPFWLIKNQCKFRSNPMTALDKVVSAVIMAGFVLIPQYWLLKNYTILILFWIFCVLTIAGFPFYLCKRCRNFKCPLNLVNKELIKETELQSLI